mmetsp:Transcript_86246/g.165989  ORF Transcript_86246/g.165989 Transcript_86246/m.165989 type:complete len:93 (-) Transcript_86246:104-382(-)
MMPGNSTAANSTRIQAMVNGTKVPTWLQEMVKEEEKEEVVEEKAQREQIGKRHPANDLLAPAGAVGSTTPKSPQLPAWAKEYLNGAQATAGG